MTLSDDDFGRALVATVRDMAITSCDSRLSSEARGAVGLRWKAAIESGGHDAIRVAIPDIVDNVIFHLLHALDYGELDLRYRSPEGEEIDLTESGELAGLYMMTGGWREFSAQRVHDDFAD